MSSEKKFIVKPHIELLIFDCDGTLFDTLLYHYQAWCDAYRSEGKNFYNKERFINELSGISGEETVEIINEQYGYKIDPVRMLQQKEKIFLCKYISQVKPINEVLSIARQYHRKMPMYVASGGVSKTVYLMLEFAKINKLFDGVVTPEHVKNNKPAPDLFLEAARQANKHPSKCFVFEDSQAGLEAARKAKMSFINIKELLYKK